MAKTIEGRGRKRTDALVAARRQQMCDAAIRLFGQKGFHNTTIESVAQVANVSVGLIYNYFKDKEDLLYFAICELQQDYAVEVPKAVAAVDEPVAQFRAAVLAYARVIDRRKRAALLGYRTAYLLGKERMNVITEKEVAINNLIADVVAKCIASGAFRQIDAQMFTYQVVVFINSWPLEAWRLPRPLSIEQFVERGLVLLLAGVLS